jgi:hypothetical protein
MLDATERKTLAWSTFVAGVLTLIPGEVPKGPRYIDYVVQVLGRLLDHRATQGAWMLCAILVVYHLWKERKELQPKKETEAETAVAPGG